MLHTALTELLGIEVPLIQAGMSVFTSPELAAAVSNAGALGSLGAWQRPPDQLRRDLEALRETVAEIVRALTSESEHALSRGAALLS